VIDHSHSYLNSTWFDVVSFSSQVGWEPGAGVGGLCQPVAVGNVGGRSGILRMTISPDSILLSIVSRRLA
jgi:hypothetical protein